MLRHLLPLLALPLLGACSVEGYAIGKLGDALAGTGTSFAKDDDPELVREATPFALKLVESVLEKSPEHEGLLLAAASGFTQYAYAFVEMDAEEVEATDVARATEMRERARKLYRRGRGYGLRGLEVAHPGFEERLRKDRAKAVAEAKKEDVPLLYWTAAAWGGEIGLGKDDPELVADLPLVEALIDRALALDEGFGAGAIHAFLISYESTRPGGSRDAEPRARAHYARAVELSGGLLAGPMVALAESVAKPRQDRREYEELLNRALAIDVDRRPEWRLGNLIVQRRARRLLAQAGDQFLE